MRLLRVCVLSFEIGIFGEFLKPEGYVVNFLKI